MIRKGQNYPGSPALALIIIKQVSEVCGGKEKPSQSDTDKAHK